MTTVQLQGWTGVQNGELIRLIDGHFDVFVLADKNLRYQQNFAERRIALVELPTNRWPILRALAPKIAAAVNQATPGCYIVVET